MPTYRHQLGTGKRFHRIHIPRTAGRFFHENIISNNFLPEQEFANVYVEGHEVIHFHKELYEKHLDVKGIPSIAIVRNPIDRFIASSIIMTCFHKKYLSEFSNLQEIMEDEYEFSHVMNNIRTSSDTLSFDIEMINWFRPQLDFIDIDTNVWHFEWGFGNSFGEWVADILKLPTFPIRKLSYKPVENLDETDRLQATPKLIDNIRKYYEDDFAVFYPNQ